MAFFILVHKILRRFSLDCHPFLVVFIILLGLLSSCSEQAEQNKRVRVDNATGEYIYRQSTDRFFLATPPLPKKRSPYPWEVDAGLSLAKITKHSFRCKGTPLHPPRIEQGKAVVDCKGSFEHGLPFIGKQEGVYAILIDLLNYLQIHTCSEVVITSGHRCPRHNTYVDSSKRNQYSKHQIGAAVNFYVKGFEDKPLEIIEALLAYYKRPPYLERKEYEHFLRSKEKTDVSIEPWYNKEIFIKLYQSSEGRNGDNQHPYPYLSIQVRFDREREEVVQYTWERAQQKYRRF